MKRKTIIKELIFGSVACDYFTITTYSLDTFRDWEAIVERMKMGEPTAKAYSQYKGSVWGNDVELMGGVQADKAHYLFTCKGANADVALRHMAAWGFGAPESVSCTRFDIQITLTPKPNRPTLMDIVSMAEKGQISPFKGKGKPTIWGWAKDGKHTLYMGSNESDCQGVVYDKLVQRKGGVETVAERYEVRFRGRRSEVLWRKVMVTNLYFSDKPMRDALLGHIDRLPVELKAFFAVGDTEAIEGDPWVVERTEKGPPNGYGWLMSLPDAIVRIASDKTEFGEEVRRMLIECYIRSVEGRNPSRTDDWAIVSPRGRVYSPRGIAYNGGAGDGSVTIKNVRHSTIKIGSIVGRDSVRVETVDSEEENPLAGE